PPVRSGANVRSGLVPRDIEMGARSAWEPRALLLASRFAAAWTLLTAGVGAPAPQGARIRARGSHTDRRPSRPAELVTLPAGFRSTGERAWRVRFCSAGGAGGVR